MCGVQSSLTMHDLERISFSRYFTAEGDGGHVEADNASEERHQSSKGNSFMLPVLMLVSILMLSLAARTTFRMVQRSCNKNQKTNMIFSPEELARYDGIKTNGRILLAIMGSVYDVSRGRRFYGT